MNASQIAIKKRLNRCSRKCFALKLLTIIDWDAVSHLLYHEKQKKRQHLQGKRGYCLLKRFKAILLGQWYNLSDPELESALVLRADFMLFCDFDYHDIPDHSTLSRVRNWLNLSYVMPK